MPAEMTAQCALPLLTVVIVCDQSDGCVIFHDSELLQVRKAILISRVKKEFPAVSNKSLIMRVLELYSGIGGMHYAFRGKFTHY